MERSGSIRWMLIVLLGVAGSTSVLRAQGHDSCGQEQLACGDEERCCEHEIAMFSNDGATAPPYLEGKCIPKAQRCSDFWCGERHCSSGIFGTPSVCCIKNDPGTMTEYRCAYNDLSCPGNNTQLTIRQQETALNSTPSEN